MSTRRCASRWGPASFGLSPEDKNIFLEQVFLLMYYMGFSYTESYDLPVWQRVWFIERINKEIKESQGQSRAADQNTPDTRAMMNRARSQVPSKLRRFT